MKTFQLKGKARDSYMELIRAFPLVSILSEDQLDQAQRVIDQLLACGTLDLGRQMYLNAPCRSSGGLRR